MIGWRGGVKGWWVQAAVACAALSLVTSSCCMSLLSGFFTAATCLTFLICRLLLRYYHFKAALYRRVSWVGILIANRHPESWSDTFTTITAHGQITF